MKKSLLLILSLAFSLSCAALLTGCGSTSDSSTPDNSVSVECQHVWEETTAKVDAECGKAGSEAVFTCDTCGETKGGEAIAALEHDWQETTAKVDAECGKAGSEAVFTCANGCGETKGGEEIPALEHDWQEAEGKVDPDCETAGKEATYICINGCGETKGGEEIPATNHAWTAVEAKAATCTADGYIAHWDCDNCDAIATGEAGSQVKVEASAIVVPASHTLATAEAQTATCTQAGWEAYQYCTECNYNEKEEFFGDHTFVDGVCSNSECGILVEATYLTYNGSLDGVAYADGKWTVTAESGKIMKFSAEAIKSYTDKKMGTLVFTFTSKSNQETSLNPSYNGDNAGNKKAVVTVVLTDEIKQNGLEMRVYYVSLGWTEGMDVSDGFVVAVDGVVTFSYEDKATWLVADNMDVSYDETADAFTLTAREGQKAGYHHPAISTELIAKWKEDGYDSLRLTVKSLNGVFTGLKFDNPNVEAVNLGTFSTDIDLNNLTTHSAITYAPEGYWVMRCYTNAEIDGLVFSLTPFVALDPANMVTFDGSVDSVEYDETNTVWTVNSTDTDKILKIDANLLKSYIDEGYTSIAIKFGSKAGQQTKWNMQYGGEAGDDYKDNASNAGSLTVTLTLESWMAEKGVQFRCYFYTRGWSGDPTNEDGSYVATDGFTVTITAN